MKAQEMGKAKPSTAKWICFRCSRTEAAKDHWRTWLAEEQDLLARDEYSGHVCEGCLAFCKNYVEKVKSEPVEIPHPPGLQVATIDEPPPPCLQVQNTDEPPEVIDPIRPSDDLKIWKKFFRDDDRRDLRYPVLKDCATQTPPDKPPMVDAHAWPPLQLTVKAPPKPPAGDYKSHPQDILQPPPPSTPKPPRVEEDVVPAKAPPDSAQLPGMASPNIIALADRQATAQPKPPPPRLPTSSLTSCGPAPKGPPPELRTSNIAAGDGRVRLSCRG